MAQVSLLEFGIIILNRPTIYRFLFCIFHQLVYVEIGEIQRFIGTSHGEKIGILFCTKINQYQFLLALSNMAPPLPTYEQGILYFFTCCLRFVSCEVLLAAFHIFLASLRSSLWTQ
eukprot:998612_1